MLMNGPSVKRGEQRMEAAGDIGGSLMHAIHTPSRDFLIYNLMRIIFTDDGVTMVHMRGEPEVFLETDAAERFRDSWAKAMKISSIRLEFFAIDLPNGLSIRRIDRSKSVWGTYVAPPVAQCPGEFDATLITADGKEIHLGKATGVQIQHA